MATAKNSATFVPRTSGDTHWFVLGAAEAHVVVVARAHVDRPLGLGVGGQQRGPVEHAVVHVDLVRELVQHDSRPSRS